MVVSIRLSENNTQSTDKEGRLQMIMYKCLQPTYYAI